jgi:hypothetical protein
MPCALSRKAQTAERKAKTVNVEAPYICTLCAMRSDPRKAGSETGLRTRFFKTK